MCLRKTLASTDPKPLKTHTPAHQTRTNKPRTFQNPQACAENSYRQNPTLLKNSCLRTTLASTDNRRIDIPKPIKTHVPVIRNAQSHLNPTSLPAQAKRQHTRNPRACTHNQARSKKATTTEL